MENQKPNPAFLHAKYRDLNSSHEVDAAARVAKRRQIGSALQPRERAITAKKLAATANPDERIQSYLDWLTQRVNPLDAEGQSDTSWRERNLTQLKKSLHRRHVIKPKEIPENYFEAQRRMAREQGHGDIEINRQQSTEVIIADQQSTLDNWIDYLASPDALYPDWLKYFAMHSILEMGRYDKEEKQFAVRVNGTVSPFPDLNREALAYALGVIEKKYSQEYVDLQSRKEEHGKEINRIAAEGRRRKIPEKNYQAGIQQFKQAIGTIEREQQTLILGHPFSKEERLTFGMALRSNDFSALYAWAIEKVTPASHEQLADTRGQWVKYNRNSNHMPLVESLQGHGTGWCTAGESTAKAQLQDGDFYVYYSLDETGKPTIPRAAIRMQENGIAEVRGVAAEQNLDPYIAPVVQAKLTEFPDGKQYEKKAADMKRLTAIERKTQSEQELTRDELVFLYEVDAPIEGFGYQRDPRITELRKPRNLEVDMLIILDCTSEQIAHTPADITEQTKAYIGAFTPGIFQKLRSVEHIYMAFPEKKIKKEELELPEMTGEEWIAELESLGINIGDHPRHMLKSSEFVNRAVKRVAINELLGRKDASSPEKETATLIRLTVNDLGFTGGATTKEIYAKAEELGLELCPAEVGPALRKKYISQPLNERICIGMKQITDSDSRPYVFELCHHYGGSLWLLDSWAPPNYDWGFRQEFVFRLRKF